MGDMNKYLAELLGTFILVFIGQQVLLLQENTSVF
jgi:glycerol uptake facilitator-like aquaporin